MTEPITPAPERGLISRALGTITAPTATFQTVVQSPRPAAILFLVCLVLAVAAGGPLFTEKGQQAALDAQIQAAEQRSSEPMPPQARETMERMRPYLGYFAIGSTFIFVPAATVVFAGLYWLLFNVILGGTATYKQVLGIAAHAQVIGALGALVGAPIQYLQGGPMTPAGPFHFGALAPMLDPQSLVSQFLTAVGFFGVWQSIVTGLGFGVLYRRKPAGMVVTVLVVYLLFTAVFFVGLPALFARR